MPFVVGDDCAAFYADYYEERIQSLEVKVIFFVKVIEGCGEIVAVHENILLVLVLLVAGLVVRIYLVVDGILCKFSVELARLAVEAEASEVVDSVGDVGCLLDFGDERAGADAVDAACRQEEHVSRLEAEVFKDIGDCVVVDSLHIFFRGDGLLESGHQVCARVCLHHIPHLSLALGAVVASGGKFVIRMYLDGKILLCVYEFDEERELLPGLLIVGLADELVLEFLYQVGDGPSGIFAVGNY